jgi:hypothetical protein
VGVEEDAEEGLELGAWGLGRRREEGDKVGGGVAGS